MKVPKKNNPKLHNLIIGIASHWKDSLIQYHLLCLVGPIESNMLGC